MKTAGLLSTFLIAVAASADEKAAIHAPGKAVFWAPSGASSSSAPEYRSQSTDKAQLHHMLAQAGSRSEIIVYLKMPSDNKPVFSHQVIVESIRGNAQHAAVVPFIYHSTRGEKPENFVRTAEIMRDAKTMSLADFSEQMRRESARKDGGILNNNKAEAYEVKLTGDATDRVHFQDLAKLALAHYSAAADTTSSRLPFTFVAMEHPHPEAVMPKMSANYEQILSASAGTFASRPASLSKDNHVGRILSDSVPTATPTTAPTGQPSASGASSSTIGNSKSIYYKPEGAEYSIYYADTYLYITPDIFTGVLTGIFFVFTLLIGLSCLNAIQGPSTFANKLPVLGREA